MLYLRERDLYASGDVGVNKICDHAKFTFKERLS
jgi:hypothetical protein